MVNTIRLATILPPGVTQFCDANGDPLANGQVFFYIPNTQTLKDTWQDSQQVSLNTNPVILNAAGEAIIYGTGQYTMAVYDQFGSLQWSAITSWTLPDSGTGEGAFLWLGTSGGTANAQTLTPADPTLTSLSVGDFVAWLVGPGLSNTGQLTISLNGGPAISVLRRYTTGPGVCSGGEVIAGDVISGVFDGTYLQLDDELNPAYLPPNLGTTAGTANAQTTAGPIEGIGLGQIVQVTAGLTNTLAVPLTLMLGTNGPYTVVKSQGAGVANLSIAEWRAGVVYFVTWNGTQVVCLNPSQTTFNSAGANFAVVAQHVETVIEATAAITLTLTQIALLFNGFAFWIFAKGGNVTITPNATDSINGGTAGASITVLQGQILYIKADGGTGWWTLASNINAARFVSTGQAWAISSVVQVAHSLGAAPINIDAFLVNISTEGSYPTGALVKISGSIGVTTFGTSTNVGASFDASGPGLVNLTTHGDFNPTPAKWNLVLVASL